MKKLEYAVSNGPGTLLDHGWVEAKPENLIALLSMHPEGATLTVRQK